MTTCREEITCGSQAQMERRRGCIQMSSNGVACDSVDVRPRIWLFHQPTL